MKNKTVLVTGIVLVVALLAGGSFMAMRLLNAKAPASNGGVLGGSVSDGKGGSKTTTEVRMERAPELPQGKAALSGSVTEVKNNSITVLPGNKYDPSISSGPATEAVITKDTRIWRDASFDNVPKPKSGDNQPLDIQQKVEPAEVSQITTDSMVIVWGQRRGDRVIADVMVVYGAAVVQKKTG
jgi:hypothetical protein